MFPTDTDETQRDIWVTVPIVDDTPVTSHRVKTVLSGILVLFWETWETKE